MIGESIIKGVSGFVKNMFGGKDDKPHFDDDLVSMVNSEFTRRQEERIPFE